MMKSYRAAIGSDASRRVGQMTDDALDYGRFEALTFDCYGR